MSNLKEGLNRLRSFVHVMRSVWKTTDRQLWQQQSALDPAWEQRVAFMARWIDLPGRVVDFGCGSMLLEKHLSREHSYQPVDLFPRDSRTLVRDLNKDPIEDIQGDIAFFSGSLEYIDDLESFAKLLKKRRFKRILASYCTFEDCGSAQSRLHLNWRNHLGSRDFIRLFLPEYSLRRLDCLNGNSVFAFSLHES